MYHPSRKMQIPSLFVCLSVCAFLMCYMCFRYLIVCGYLQVCRYPRLRVQITAVPSFVAADSTGISSENAGCRSQVQNIIEEIDVPVSL